nr:MAG TPA: hypothetical protein [Caudoviricetes sp.]
MHYIQGQYKLEKRKKFLIQKNVQRAFILGLSVQN